MCVLNYSDILYSVQFFRFRLSAADVEACFKEFDKDKDNRLNYGEFCVMMNTRKHSLDILLDEHRKESAAAGSSPPGQHRSPRKSPLKSPQRKYLAEQEDSLSVATDETNVD